MKILQKLKTSILTFSIFFFIPQSSTVTWQGPLDFLVQVGSVCQSKSLQNTKAESKFHLHKFSQFYKKGNATFSSYILWDYSEMKMVSSVNMKL